VVVVEQFSDISSLQPWRPEIKEEEIGDLKMVVVPAFIRYRSKPSRHPPHADDAADTSRPGPGDNKRAVEVGDDERKDEV
jgi:hypothetical protein